MLLTAILSGCYVQNAGPEKDLTLVIASDYLEEGDSLLFADFSKKENVRVVIKHINAGSLVGQMQNNRYAHGIDLVMMKSLYSVYNLNRADLFHPVHHITEGFQSHEKYMSEKYKFVGLGIDPYVFASNPDTNVRLHMYNDLKSISFINTLDEEDMIPWLSPLMSKMNKVECYNWVKSVLKNEKKLGEIDKFQAKSIPVVLTTFENYSTHFKEDSILSKYTQLSFPNSRSSGTFYNLRTVCITAQAQHYASSNLFIKYYLSSGNNKRLNGKLNTFSIYGEQSNINTYHVDCEDLIQYYSMFKRIMSKVT